MKVIEIIDTLLEEDAKRFGIGLSKDKWVAVAASNIGKASDMTEDFTKRVRTFPGDRESSDPSGTDAANGAAIWILREVIGLTNLRDDLFDDEAGVAFSHGVIFEAPVLAAVLVVLNGWNHSWIDEYADCRWHRSLVDQVVEYGWRSKGAARIYVAPTVVEDHQATRAVRLILSGDVNPVVPFCAWINATPPYFLDDLPLGDAFNDVGIWSELGIRGTCRWMDQT